MRKRWDAFASLPWYVKPFVVLASPFIIVMVAGWIIVLVFVGIVFACLLVVDPDQL